MTGLKLSIALSLGLCAFQASSHQVSGRVGHGLIGYGIRMYYPLCAYACRDLLSSSMLNCTPHMDEGDMEMSEHMEDPTPPECYATDDAFLQTLAYCMSQNCQDVPVWELEQYWEQSLVGRQVVQPVPKATYQETLDNITSPPTEVLTVGDDLNRTMLISNEDYIGSYNGQGSFEAAEVTHSTYGIVLIVSGALIPIAVSLLRFLPFPAALSTEFNTEFIYPPLFGHRHKEPVFGLFHMPTRGQSLFILYLVGINVILCSVGLDARQPNTWFASSRGVDGEIFAYLSNRFGVLSYANIPLLILYSGRNNFLLWLTDWSHGTFLLMHRWVAWIATLQAVLHSAMYLRQRVHSGEHATESQMPYWIWGIVATLGMSLLLPASVLPIRRKFYELFLAWHVLVSIFVLAGCYWHILLRFDRQWGYQYWILAAVAVWGAERAMRIARLARNGVCTARVTVVDDDYVRVDIEGVSGNGHAYLHFPTLTWRVWENHPFSVAATTLPSAADKDVSLVRQVIDPAEKNKAISDDETSDSDATRASMASATPRLRTKPGLTFLLRTKSGLTRALRGRSSLPVLVESSYGPIENFSAYDRLVCIAGGVGITACIPYLRSFPVTAKKLFWGARGRAIVDALAGEIQGTGAEVTTFVDGERMDIEKVLRRELVGIVDEGLGAVVLVSGPDGMADEVRKVIVELGAEKRGIRVKLVEEAFCW